jgi:hypothetical protein
LQPDPGLRTEQTLHGYVAGFENGVSEATQYRSIITNNSPTDVVIRTIPDPTGQGRVFATFNFRSTDGESFSSGSIEFGDAPGTAPAAQSLFIDNTNFYALQNAPASAGKGQIDGSPATVDAVLVSIPAAAQADMEVGGSLCSCEFVTWGLWAATMDAPSLERNLYVPVGLWVAGKLPNINDPSPQGSATFSGSAIGMVQSQGQQYFAAGSFTNNYNFNQRTGAVSINNFDGKSFGGAVSAGGNDWRSYSGALQGSGVAGTINGAFYGNRNSAGQLQTPKETAGNFNVNGSGYAVSGIFAGTRGGPAAAGVAR